MSTLFRKFGGSMSLTIQAISSHPFLIRSAEEILADIEEYPFLPSALNARDAAGLVSFPGAFPSICMFLAYGPGGICVVTRMITVRPEILTCGRVLC
jgi:hypothetical protein